MWCGCRVGVVCLSLDEGWHLWATIAIGLAFPLFSVTVRVTEVRVKG